MNLVDSCGWLEYFADGPNASFFAAALEEPEHLLVPTICIMEVSRRMLQQRGEAALLHAVAAMRQGSIAGMDEAIAVLAARLSLEHHLPLADSVILATGRANQATIWTEDAHFKDIAGVQYAERTA